LPEGERTCGCLSGFEPFGGESINPSWKVARRLEEAPLAGVEVVGICLPVAQYRAVDLAVAAIERIAPDLVISLGQAGGRARVTSERIAVNVDDYRMPDNDGNQPDGRRIAADGPDAYLCTLPVKRMVAAMIGAGVPAAISNTAGTYLCNHVAFSVLHYLSGKEQQIPAGFVHLPYLPEQVLSKPGEVPSMTLDLMLAGLEAGLSAAVEALQPLAGAV